VSVSRSPAPSLFGRCASGAAAIEFAILMPVLVLFIVGTFAVSWAIHGVSSVNYALEQTSRMLQLDRTVSVSSLQSAINAKLASLGKQQVTLTLTHEAPAGDTDIAHVTARYDFPVRVPLLTTWSLTFQRTATVILSVTPPAS
jgi:Flp pilus assembly protein TadG